MKVTLWYKYDKQTDSYKYNHLDINGWIQERKPHHDIESIRKGFASTKWLKDFAYLENKAVVYNV